jgi:hypothetical protein
MAGHRPVRVLMSTLLTTLMLVVAPLAHGDHALAAGNPTSTQTLTMNVPVTGTLTVSTPSGTVSWSYPDSADLGQLSFTNTLNDISPWSITAAMTDLVPSTAPASCDTSSTNCLSFTNVQLVPSSDFTGLAGAPTASLQRGSPGNFAVGPADSSPGTTYSSSGSVLIDGGGDKGNYTQGNGSTTDNKLTPTAGLHLQPGSYTGTLQYTITG